ncbi:MAG: sulfurtransferase [Candidatus Hydrogenedentes bacterium]|nr:sulfurtransferase [Candidatus Hydrogenedentota bacterium]
MTSLLLLFCVGALQGDALLVATDDLQSLENTLVVDTRTTKDFEAGHIPGAAHLEVGSLSETRDGVAGMLKPTDALSKALGAAGVDPAKHIVVYCGMATADDFKDAARLFWILEYVGYEQVSILDGGFAKWQAGGRPIEKGGSKVAAVPTPKLTLKPELLATYEEVEAAAGSGQSCVADLRSADYYRGEKKAEIAQKAGHIPGSSNLPAEDFIAENRTVKLLPELEALVSSDGITKDKPVITYCNSGRSASVGYFMLRRLGREHVSMYDGSMAEWTAKDKPVETGAEKK